MVKINKKRVYEIQEELPQILDYIPYHLRIFGFEYRIWIDNVDENCSLEDSLAIQKRLSKSTLLTEEEKMEELIEWLKDYPQYKDVIIED